MSATTQTSQPPLEVDTLILGSGLAGLICALKAPTHSSVAILTKGDLRDSNTDKALGGIASVSPLSEDQGDSYESHIDDTLRAGDGLCHEEIVSLVIRQGPTIMEQLIKWGVGFSKQDLSYHLTKEGGHSHRRIWHASAQTGKALVQALSDEVRRRDNISIYEHEFAVDLITTDKVRPNFSESRCLGAYILPHDSEMIYPLTAQRTVLCTGGYGRAYLYTSNPPHATGDGLAMARRAGAKVANLEFMQFHPTALYHHREKNTLISEALRGEGAILVNTRGEDFTSQHDPRGSLAPRDVLARAIYHDLKKSGLGHVYLDTSAVPTTTLKNQFTHITQHLRDLGIDILNGDLIPVTPCAHYSCGGVVSDRWGQTSLRGLYAIGEVACTGLHGGNRLASNSLLEAGVMGHRVIEGWLSEQKPSWGGIEVPPWKYAPEVAEDERDVLNHTWDEIRAIMWNYVGIVRTTTRLKRALRKLTALREELDEYYWQRQPTRHLMEVRNLALVAHLTVQCALRRKESRGCHYTSDFPDHSSTPKDTMI